MPKHATSPLRFLLPFGFLVGLLTALSTAAGTTITLIGLLFALIGGSLVSWFRTPAPAAADDKNAKAGSGAAPMAQSLTPDQLTAVAGTANGIALGILLGLTLGFGLRGIDLFLIQPRVPPTPAEHGQQEQLGKIEQSLAALKGSPEELRTIKDAVEKGRPSTPPRAKSAVLLQAGELNRIRLLAEKLDGKDQHQQELKKALVAFADTQARTIAAIQQQGNLPAEIQRELDELFK